MKAIGSTITWWAGKVTKTGVVTDIRNAKTTHGAGDRTRYIVLCNGKVSFVKPEMVV